MEKRRIAKDFAKVLLWTISVLVGIILAGALFLGGVGIALILFQWICEESAVVYGAWATMPLLVAWVLAVVVCLFPIGLIIAPCMYLFMMPMIGADWITKRWLTRM